MTPKEIAKFLGRYGAFLNLAWFSAWMGYLGITRGIRSVDFQFSSIILAIIVALILIPIISKKRVSETKHE